MDEAPQSSNVVIHPGTAEPNTKRLVLYKYLTPIALTGLLKNGDLKITFPQDANDPLELLPKGENPQSKRQRKETQMDLGFLSLTKDYNCPPMWGNYADKYKGACIQFEFRYFFCNPNKAKLSNFVERFAYDGVIIKEWGLNTYYLQYREKHNCKVVKTKGDILLKCVYQDERSSKEPPAVMQEDKRKIMLAKFTRNWLIIATKHKSWEYEQEYRLPVIRNESTRSDYQIPSMYFTNCLTRYITKIILGPNCALSVDDVKFMINSRIKSCGEDVLYIPKDVKVVKAQFKNNDYLLKIPREQKN